MAIFYNQATLSYGDTVTNSNVTEGQILSGITISKTAVSSSYSRGSGVVYAVTITNSAARELSGLTLTDDLGAYGEAPSPAVTPLSYVEGSLLYYRNGILTDSPEAVAGPPLTINGISLPAGGSVTLIYEATANGFAPLAQGSSILNTVTVSGAGEPLSDTAEVPVRDELYLTISKSLSPEVVGEDGVITYTFVVQNFGNRATVATDDVVITDSFNPILENISVTLNGEALAEGTGYTYDNTTGLFRTVIGAISVPAATYTVDPITGAISATPGTAILTVTGNI